MRAKRWSAAQRELRFARPLPPRLAQTRRKLEKFVAEREREQQRSFSATTANSYWSPVGVMPQVPVIMPVEPGYGRFPQRAPASPKPAPKPPAGGMSFSATPAFSSTQVFSNKDYHGLRTATGKTQTRDTKVKLQMQSESAVKSAGGAMLAINVPLEFKNSLTNSSGEEQSFQRDPESPDTVTGQTKNTAGPTSKALAISTNPGVSVPFSATTDFEAAFNYAITLPDYEGENKSSRRKPEAGFNTDIGAWNLVGKFAYDQSFDNHDENIATSTIFSGTASVPVGKAVWNLALTHTSTAVPDEIRPASKVAASSLVATGSGKFDGESVDFSVTGNYQSLERFPDTPISVPASVVGITAAVDIPFGIFSIGGSFGFKSLSDLQQSFTSTSDAGDEVKQTVVAEGDQTSFSGNFKFTAVKWLSLSTEYVNTSTKWAANNPAVQKDFLRANADQEGLTTINATVSWQF